MSSRIRKAAALLVAIAIATCMAATPALAKTKTTNVSNKQLTAGLSSTFIDSPNYSGFYDGRYANYQFGPFQNFCISPDKKHIFATDIAKRVGGTYAGIMNNTGLLCYGINGKTATFRDGTVLNFYGHSDVLAVTQPNLKKETYYVWVAKSKVKKPKNPSQYYGKVIERITFKFPEGSDKTVVTGKIELKNFANTKVSVDGKKKKAAKFSGGTPERVSVAANQKDNRIAFRLRFKDGYGVNYLVYDLKKLSKVLDKQVAKGKKSYDMKKSIKYQIADIASTLIPCDEYKNRAESGFQAFDVDKKNLYICGHTKWAKAKYKAGIYKMPYKADSKIAYKNNAKTDVSQNIRIAVATEIQSIKVAKSGKKNAYYIYAIEEGATLRDGQHLYKIVR